MVNPTNKPKTNYLKYLLGETTIEIEIYQCSSHTALIYFHPHEDEITSDKITHKTIDERGGTGYFLRHNGDRLITFTLKNKTYKIDPNRMFSIEGIGKDLKLNGNSSKEAIEIINQFAIWLVGLISSKRVIAVHNNLNQDYNILSYIDKNNNPVEGIDAVYINEKENTGNFIYTNNIGLFSVAKINEINAVLQGDSILNIDDGSYSLFAQKNNIDYTNIEATIGDSKNNMRLISFVCRYYNSPVIINNPTWKTLQFGDIIDLVATSSVYEEKELTTIKNVIESYGLIARDKYAKQVSESPSLGYSAPNDVRLKQLVQALNDKQSKAVWGIKGGGGATNLLPKLLNENPPNTLKPLIGFSDMTAVHLFLNSKWNWPTIHGIVALFNEEVNKTTNSITNNSNSIKSMVELLKGEIRHIQYDNVISLNDYAKNINKLESTLIGGNLTLVSTSLSTLFGATSIPHILILEDIGNTVRQLERFLNQIKYSDMLKNTKAIILGEFLENEEDTNCKKSATNVVMRHFASTVSKPVFLFKKFGHGKINNPIPLLTKVILEKSQKDFKITINIPTTS